MRASVVVFACLASLVLVNAAFAANPAVLICSPIGPSYGYADLNYVRELHQAGFEVDYTDSLDDVIWERIKQYNVVVLYRSPDVAGWGPPPAMQSARDAEFAQAVLRFAEAGGGVFLFPSEDNNDRQVLLPFTEAWGAKLPAETIEEKSPEFVGPQTHDSQATPLAYTDQIVPSPLTEGVKGLWYPSRPVYNAAMTGPIFVDDKWQVLVKASLTAVTKPVDMSKSPNAIPNPFTRPEGVVSPPLFAVRSAGAGRVALLNQWRQFSIGSGTRYIYNREVLERGIKGKPSDFGRLLENTFRWLAAPSLQNGAVGGFVTKPERLLPPNWREEAKQEYLDKVWPYDPAALGQ